MCYTKLPIFTESLEFEADLVIIMLGTNDCCYHLDKDIFKAHYRALIEKYGRDKCIIVTPPPVLIDWNSIDLAIILIQEVASEVGLSLVELHDKFEDLDELFDEDKIHFNADGYKYIASI